MKKSVAPQLPKGFTAITSGGNSWKPDKPGESIEGIMVGVKVVTIPKKGRQPERDCNVYKIKTKNGDVDVWESAGLRALANIKKGKPVYIAYVGKKKIPGQQQPMRDFVVATK